jgi:PhzF family phenazine biosynthesis protein
MHFALYDVFSCGGFSGNPAAVIRGEGDLPEVDLLSLAKEFNQPETCWYWFEGGTPHMRFSTSERVINACGHGTLAVLADVGLHAGQRSASGLSFIIHGMDESRWEFVEAAKGDVLTSALWPGTPSVRDQLPVKETAALLGLDAAALRKDLPLASFDSGITNGLVPIVSSEMLERACPDTGEGMKRFFETHRLDDLHAYALLENADPSKEEITVRTRNVFPYGVREEAASGAASVSLACALAQHLGSRVKRFLFRQGVARIGHIIVKTEPKGPGKLKLWLEGRVTRIASGEDLNWPLRGSVVQRRKNDG